MQSNKRCNAHWERNPRQYAHYPEPLFDVFTSKEALRRVLFVRNIDVRGWTLHLTDPTSESAKPKHLPHDESFCEVCEEGHVDIVRAMVERTQVELEAKDAIGRHH